jgi:glycyl-tRNA synthetase
MSEALYNIGGLRFWTEREIMLRNQAIETLSLTVRDTLTRINSAWSFHRVEGPLLTPREHISAAYDESDIFMLRNRLGDSEAALRAETTASSYLYADFLMKRGLAKMPTCIWQAGKSFRRETTDGARASTLRYNEFYQLEFQCIYSLNTKADYRAHIEPVVAEAIRRITQAPEARLVDSDRLPDYSLVTRDVEVPFNGKWKEMASISTRNDFHDKNALVLEIAIGLDRLIAVESSSKETE